MWMAAWRRRLFAKAQRDGGGWPLAVDSESPFSQQPSANGHPPRANRLPSYSKSYTMTRIAFKMKLFRGFEEEYRKRHDELWPELRELLKSAGIYEYSIFLDETTNDLFGFLKAENPKTLNDLPAHPVMQRWWKYMGDIMESNSDNSPVSIPLKEVFFLP
jgi:L-rhamnose mutarotase